jgi:hypothetical protein
VQLTVTLPAGLTAGGAGIAGDTVMAAVMPLPNPTTGAGGRSGVPGVHAIPGDVGIVEPIGTTGGRVLEWERR